jgi:hypothetical protein
MNVRVKLKNETFPEHKENQDELRGLLFQKIFNNNLDSDNLDLTSNKLFPMLPSGTRANDKYRRRSYKYHAGHTKFILPYVPALY